MVPSGARPMKPWVSSRLGLPLTLSQTAGACVRGRRPVDPRAAVQRVGADHRARIGPPGLQANCIEMRSDDERCSRAHRTRRWRHSPGRFGDGAFRRVSSSDRIAHQFRPGVRMPPAQHPPAPPGDPAGAHGPSSAAVRPVGAGPDHRLERVGGFPHRAHDDDQVFLRESAEGRCATLRTPASSFTLAPPNLKTFIRARRSAEGSRVILLIPSPRMMLVETLGTRSRQTARGQSCDGVEQVTRSDVR